MCALFLAPSAPPEPPERNACAHVLRGRRHRCACVRVWACLLQGMGTSDRFFYDNPGLVEKGVPGPGTYTLKSAQGKQVTSNKTSYPISSFPRADRDRTAEKVYLGPKQQGSFWGRNSPGPAVYSPTASVGAQCSSEKPNVPKFGFGTADRFAYINIGQRAMQSPGPGSYSI